IDVVLPIGGASRLEMFRRALEAQWGQPLREYDNPDEAVAKGAAIAAGIERRTFEDSQRDIMILDVSPHRLGVSAIRQVGPGQFIEGYFSEIIPKDTKLPATQRQQYGTMFGTDETPISIQIYEATTDSNLCVDHRLIAELPLRRLNAGGSIVDEQIVTSLLAEKEREQSEMVQVEFRYTLDGTLDVAVQYIDAPMVRVAGHFVVTGKGSQSNGLSGDTASHSNSGNSSNGHGSVSSVLEMEPATGSLISAAMAHWRETPHADLCAPLLDQAERLLKDHPEASPAIRKSCDAVKFSLVTGDEREVRQMLDALTEMLFEMA
ncbi:MAG: Hsp70 family protein, partial [Armatimonadota bacterium]